MRTRKQIIKLLTGIALACMLVGGVAGTATAGADQGDVTVTLKIRPAVAAAVTDGGITVKANTDWALQAEASGSAAEHVAASGGPTGAKGAFVAVEGDVESFTLVGR
jgi:hypothetical protein